MTYMSKIGFIIDWFIFVLSHVVPKKKGLWICSGWHQGSEGDLFADNSKYFFLHVANERKDIQIVWIAKEPGICGRLAERGYEAFPYTSLKGAWRSLRAEVTVTDGLLIRGQWRYTGRSRVVQLWHGKGPKRAGLKGGYQKDKLTAFSTKITSPNLFRKYEFLVAYSDYAAELMADSFGYPKSAVKATGIPKYDVFVSDQKDADIDVHEDMAMLLEEAASKYEKVLLYAPTFRSDGSNPVEEIDLPALNEKLKELNWFCIGTLHPKLSSRSKDGGGALSNVAMVAPGFDYNPLMKEFDGLITDYSSLAVDFAFLEKPVLFYVYDLEKYKQEVGLYEDLWDLLKGPRVQTSGELAEVIEDTFRQERVQHGERLFDRIDADASSRITELITPSR